MRHIDLIAGEHYAYDRTPKTAAYYSPSRVRLVSTDKYSPSPQYSRTQVRITDGAITAEVNGSRFTRGNPLVAVCFDDPGAWNNYQLVPVSQLGSTWADWETTKAERDTARAASDHRDQLARETRSGTIARIETRLAELGVSNPGMSAHSPNVAVGIAWLETLIDALDREP